MALRPKRKSMKIWIDSICINQAHKKEKSWQVGMMGDIYRHSTKAIAWLGPADDCSDSIIDYLNTLGKKAEACGLQWDSVQCVILWQLLVAVPSVVDCLDFITRIWTCRGQMDRVHKDVLGHFTRLVNLFYSISGWHSQDNLLPMAGIKRLLQRPWWGRIWVLQEIALSEHADFVCGTKRISRSRMGAAYNAYHALWSALSSQWHRNRSLTDYQMSVLLSISGLHRSKVMLSAWRIYKSGGFPMAALLRATSVESVHLLGRNGYQHLKSSHPLDKIFALPGLAADREEFGNFGVVPDYSKSQEEIYTIAMAALLQQGYISMLSFCRTSGVARNLPSWVPDWSQAMPATWQDVLPDHVTLSLSFNASGAHLDHPKVTILRQHNMITGVSILCRIYDVTEGTGKVARIPLTGTCVWYWDWLLEIFRLTCNSRNIYETFDDRLRAVARTSFGGTGYDGDGFLTKIKDDRFFDALCLMKEGISNIGRYNIKPSLRRQLKQYLESKNVNDMIERGAAIPSRLKQDIMRMSPKRAPFITRKGHLGLTYWHVKPGDFVELIAGAQVPFILRRHSDDHWRIVSEAYVDGIMDGEAAEDDGWREIKLV